VRSATNRGFGGGCNLGFAATDAPHVLFLNPDAVPEPGAIAALAAAVERDPGIAAVGARLVDPRGETRAAAAGAEPGLRSVAGHFLLLSRLPLAGRLFPPLQLPDGSRRAPVDWVSAGAMLVRREAFEAIGGFDERFFLYMEDVDLCRRLREAGFRVGYEGGAVVRHAIGGSQAPDQPARWYRAFHAYLAERRGRRVARLAAAMAAAGMALRWFAYRGRRPTQAGRMRAAARAAAALALKGSADGVA
jgi:GT2 family glycosyltransferase